MPTHGHSLTTGREWLNFILFIGIYLLFNYGYFKIPIDLFVNVLYYHGVVSVCADLINMLAPSEQVLAQHNHLFSAKADLEIVRGCDGAGVLFLLMSAILVYPAKMPGKLLGLGLAFVLIYTVNLLRIGVLYFIIAYQADWFMLIHTYVAPTLMVVIGCAYFAWWVFSSADNSDESG
ncbi:MAG: exosortase family protein XrtM [Methylococcales bacterium]